MEKQKNNKILIIFVCVLCVLLLATGGYILFNKVVTKPTSKNIQQNTESPEETNDNTICVISSNVVFKNIKDINGRTTSDVYINDNFASKITYDTNTYNECKQLGDNTKEKGDYYLIVFANEAALYSDFYLFNKSGKYISNFDEWRKKHDSSYYLSVTMNEGNELLIDYYAGMGYETIYEAYCKYKAKPNDIQRITEFISIENDELIIKNEKKETWKDIYLCTSDNTEDCGDITKVVCNN